MITTRGFRDVIELGRRTRPQPYGMTGTFVPVIPRNLRLEVRSASRRRGGAHAARRGRGARRRSAACVEAGCESLVIHFLHSYANPAHERRAAEIAAEIWPNGHITVGHALLSEAREFERGVTASVNAAVRPILERYVERLRAELAGRGYARDFLIMNGNGGMISARFVTREAAKTVMSGPASGVIAAAYTGARAGYRNLVTYDMGGTSTDVALIRDAEPAVSNEIEIEYAMPIHVPMVDVHTVGAGGGSIARVDAAGLIQVGPESAGANPGPICYGRGGKEPTITDANLVLGRLSAPSCWRSMRRFRQTRSGRSSLRGSARHRPGRRRRCCRSAETRQHEDGRRDPHGVGIARPRSARLRAVRLRRRRAAARVRAGPRTGAAEGAGAGPAGHHQCARLRRGRPAPRFRQHAEPAGGALDEARAMAILERHQADGVALIAKEAVRPAEIRFVHSADMQFVGQTHILNVPLPSTAISRGELQHLFEAAYFARFKVSLPEIRANLVNLNSSVIGVRGGARPVDADRPGGPRNVAGRRAQRAAAGMVRWRLARDAGLRSAKSCRSTRSSKVRRSSSSSTRPRSSSPATA